MNQKENLKEKFKQALFSTIKVISDNYKFTFIPSLSLAFQIKEYSPQR